jgi:hypothetical protein
MIICASDTGLEVLKRAEVLSVDGTFASCPPPFVQVNFSLTSFMNINHRIPITKRYCRAPNFPPYLNITLGFSVLWERHIYITIRVIILMQQQRLRLLSLSGKNSGSVSMGWRFRTTGFFQMHKF